jgi:hypothetical protein
MVRQHPCSSGKIQILPDRGLLTITTDVPFTRKFQRVRSLPESGTKNKYLMILPAHNNGQIHGAFSPFGRTQKYLHSHCLNWHKSHSDDTNSVFAKKNWRCPLYPQSIILVNSSD